MTAGRPPIGVEYLDHTADIGIRARGPTLERAFEAAARGTFAIMIDLNGVRLSSEHRVAIDAGTPEMLLVEWLGNLLVQKDVSGIVFSTFEVQIKRVSETYTLRGIARGEPIDPERHRIGIEVKGISYLGLSVHRVGAAWFVDFVLDV